MGLVVARTKPAQAETYATSVYLQLSSPRRDWKELRFNFAQII